MSTYCLLIKLKGNDNLFLQTRQINTKMCSFIFLCYLFNLIKIQLFIILSYEHLTAAHSRSCADDLFHLPIKSQLTKFRKLKALKFSCTEYFDWLMEFPEKLQRSSAHDLLWAAVRCSYDSLMKSCISIRLLFIQISLKDEN